MLNQSNFEKTIHKQVSLPYLIWQPQGDPPYGLVLRPLIVFLHGSGERGDDLEALRESDILKYAQGNKGLPYLIALPQCPLGADWSQQMDALDALVEHLQERYPVDAQRVYLSGLSMGGRAALQLAALKPHKFAALAVMSCRRPDVFGRTDVVSQLKGMPIWIFHGALDAVVPLTQALQVAEMLRNLGCRVRTTVYPGAHHDTWKLAYHDPELYSWLFTHEQDHPTT